MNLQIKLNNKQSNVLQEMFQTGLRGKTIEEAATRILDSAFIDFCLMMHNPPEEKEPWQRDKD